MDRERLWLLLPAPVRRLSADLAAVLALVGLTNAAVFLPVVNDSPLRVVVGLAFVLFVPGYAFVAALFPEAGEPPTADDGSEPDGGLQDRGIDGIERTALSFGLTIAIVPLIGLALNFTPFGIRLVPILVGISGFTAVATAVAARRRWDLPADERFAVPYREWLAAGRSELLDPGSTVDAALNVALVVAILLATTSVVYAVAVPQQGEQFTEFYVLTENETGDLVTEGYPGELSADDPESIHVGVENNEYEELDYTVVVQLQAVEFRESVTTAGPNGTGTTRTVNETVVTDRTELTRYSTTVPHNGSDIRQQNLSVDDETATAYAGDDRRVKFLLYRGDVPARPTAANARWDLQLWVEVESGS